MARTPNGAARSAMVCAISRARAKRGRRVVGHLLDQPDPVRLGGVELVAGEQPAHGVPPSGFPRQPKRRAAERIDAALHFELGEPRPGCRDADIGGQQQLDAQRHAPAMRGRDQRRGPCAVQPPRVTPVVGELQSPAATDGADVDEIQTPVKWSPWANSTPARTSGSDSSSP